MESQSSITPQSLSTFSDSSKTASSKSGEEDDEKKEQDLTKDNASSPIDLECDIQAERIAKILDEAAYKTKLAICIPYLVNEYQPLKEVLSVQHFNDLIFIFEQYDNPVFTTSLVNMSAMEDIKAGDFSLKTRLNPELGHLMYIIHSYPTLKPVVEMKISQMKDEYQNGELRDKPEHRSMEYLLMLEKFIMLMVVQTKTTAEDELGAKIQTRKLEASNKKLTDLIRDFSNSLKKETAAFEELIAEKKELSTKLEQELVFIHHEATTKLKKKILDSDRQMVLASRSHAVKNEMLKEEELEMREAYNNLLKTHVTVEKKQRARRSKVETQLLSWLHKYDVEMADKQVELDEYIEKYEDECKKCEELEAKLAEQDIKYIPLMAEREAEYQKEMTEKMTKFLLEHAARVIQTAWRQVLANRAEKSKLRKRIKKMLKAQAAAESKAPKRKVDVKT